VAKIQSRTDGTLYVRVISEDGCITDNIFRTRERAQRFIDSRHANSDPIGGQGDRDLLTIVERDPNLKARLRRLIEHEVIRKHDDDLQTLPVRKPEDRRPRAPMQINRTSERAVYDLDDVSGPALGTPRKVTIERAERAIDLARFPGRDQETPKAHLTALLHRGESEDFSSYAFALHILSTGSEGYRSAFLKTIETTGTGNFAILTPEEVKACATRMQVRAMSVGTGSAGGFTVPYTADPTLVPTSAGSRNPYRAVCRVEQTTGNEYRGVTTGGVTMAYASEGAVSSDNSATYAQPALILNRAQGFVPISRELYADWEAALDQLSAEFQRAKDDLEAPKFTTGTGTGEPQGLITGATTTLTAGGTAAIAPSDLYAAEQAWPARFRPRAAWFLNKLILNDVLKDANTGAAVFYPNALAGLGDGSNGVIGNLIGYRAGEVSAMASVLTTGSKVAALGDPSMFLIVDHVGGMEVEVISHLSQQAVMGSGIGLPTAQRGVWAAFRNTSKVLDASAFRVIVTG